MYHAVLIPDDIKPPPDEEELERRCQTLECILADAAGVDAFEDLVEFAILDLPNEGLVSLPESFGLLEDLQGVSLSGNKLQVLPESFGHLCLLQDLNLSNNKLAHLPQSFGQLQQLEDLDLSHNELSYVPNLPMLQKLLKLSLAHNQLVGDALPSSLGRLGKLQRLDVSDNKLSALPESLGQLKCLEALLTQSNQLELLPANTGSLSKLKVLDVRRNKLTALPPAIGTLFSLVSIRACQNRLSEIPESIGELPKLKALELSENLLSCLPQNLQKLRALESLDLRSNPLVSKSKSISLDRSPNTFVLAVLLKLGALQNLKLLDGENCVPRGLQKLLDGPVLDATDCQLRELPHDFGLLPCVRELLLQRNLLQAIPPSICNMSLTHLILAENRLSSLPVVIANLESLRTLDLTGNALMALPERICQLCKLERLHLSQNPLISLPKDICKIASLLNLEMRQTKIAELPGSFDDLVNLQHLDLVGSPLAEDLSRAQQGHCPRRRMLYLMHKYDSLSSIRLSVNQPSKMPEVLPDWSQAPPPKPLPKASAKQASGGYAWNGSQQDRNGFNRFFGATFSDSGVHEESRSHRRAAEEAGGDTKLRLILENIENQLELCPDSTSRQRLLRSLFRQWHPDKRRDAPESATRVFQWLQSVK